jgi:hypothetical protein
LQYFKKVLKALQSLVDRIRQLKIIKVFDSLNAHLHTS